MGSVNATTSGTLFLDFRYRNRRCKEYTKLKDSPANRVRLKKILERIEAEITLGRFNYGEYFPDSSRVAEFERQARRANANTAQTPVMSDFSETWYGEMVPQWRASHTNTVRLTLDKYLIPEFGEQALDSITKAEILDFRSKLAKQRNKSGKSLSSERINHILTPLRMILNEAADRFGFVTPYRGIKSLKVPKTQVQPFTLPEVNRIINSVRRDFRAYYTVRFFTAMRTSEIDGLQWKYVDFERREILIEEVIVDGKLGGAKTDGSHRVIHMSQPVYEALLDQRRATGQYDFVFCNSVGKNLSHHNVTKRVWYPLLRLLDIPKRRPYQTRHTAATLWLAAGENPEWIARQMGHSTTEMLFRVYSRYVPNLTRKDGSAFEAILLKSIAANPNGEDES